MHPIIFIPGIEATALANTNTFDFKLIWNAFDSLGTAASHKILGPHIEDSLLLDPLFDDKISSIIERHHIASLPYESALRSMRNQIKDAQIFLFGYDWRKSNIEIGKKLKEYVDYLKAKFSFMGYGPDVKFSFITHSMGALTFACFLNELKGDYSTIHKVALCAPPLRGSPYALQHMIKGAGGLRSFFSRTLGFDDSLRKVIRTYPSVYELLPWYDKALIKEDTGETLDITNKNNWQSNIYDDIEPLFSARLSALQTFHEHIRTAFYTLPKIVKEKIIIIAGIKDNTLTRLNIQSEYGTIKNFVDFKNTTETSGDGTVPEISATIYKDSMQTFIVEKDSFFNNPEDHIDYHGFFLKDSRVQNIVTRFMNVPHSPKGTWWKSIGNDVHLL